MMDIYVSLFYLTSVDQSTDTCTNNFATWNPLDNFYPNTTLSEGNLKCLFHDSNESFNLSTIGVSQGKWYFENKNTNSSDNENYTGVTYSSPDASTDWLGNNAYGWGYMGIGRVYNSASIVATPSSYATNDIIGVALDMDNNKLHFSKNGVWQNSSDPANNTNGISITADKTYFFATGDKTGASSQEVMTNFGSPPYAISSGNADGNGYGNFEYAVPSGYYALNTKNLAEFG